MEVSGTPSDTSSKRGRQGDSFAAMIHKESAETLDGQRAFSSARASHAADLAAGFGAVSPDFVSALGEGILDAIALGEGAADEMQRFEEKKNHR